MKTSLKSMRQVRAPYLRREALIFSALMLALTLGFSASPLTGTGVIRVPEDFGTIQAAVDAASSGDIILVRPGFYHESVLITKSGISLIGVDA